MKAHHQMVLVVLAAHYRGENNGDLALTRKMALHYGIKSERARCGGLRELAERGLIVKACQGGMRPLGPTTWALTWEPINYWAGRKLDAVRIAGVTDDYGRKTMSLVAGCCGFHHASLPNAN